VATPAPLNLDNIQGNSLGVFKKDFQSSLFLKFAGDKAGRAWIAEVAAGISSSGAVIQFNNQFRALKKQGGKKPEALISAVWMNLAFSFAGLQALRVNPADLAEFPDTFKNGMANATIGDVGTSNPSTWIPPFTMLAHVHAVLIVAADHGHELAKKVAEITGTAAFKAGVQVLLNQEGRTRSDAPGREHFGSKDGVSQPGVRGVYFPDDPIGNPDQGHPGQDLLWPGEFVTGYEGQLQTAKPGHDGPNPEPGPLSESGPAWTKDGAYLVFRRLKQDVPGFEKSIQSLAKLLGWSEEMTRAKLVGQDKSGCPIEQRKFPSGPYTAPSIDPGDPHHGNPALANGNTLNYNFELGNDPQGADCSMSVHMRTRRQLGRGIPHGEPFKPHVPGSANVDRGLLFLSCQNDISNHIEFVENAGVNHAKFPPNPGAQPPLKGDPGQAPILAPSPTTPMLIDPDKAPVAGPHFVTTTGGGYFLSPSRDTLQALASGTI
jgi:deferrochelatase/peroxidase EfeB